MLAELIKPFATALESRPVVITTLSALAAGTMLSPTLAPWAAVTGAAVLAIHAVRTPDFSLSDGLRAVFDGIRGKNVSPANSDTGILLLGHDRATGTEVRLTASEAREHVAVIGDTAAGKSDALLGMAESVISSGAGLVFMDGTGDLVSYARIHDIAKQAGRADDVLVLNFMTGSRQSNEAAFMSHTFNPFANSSLSTLTQIMVSMMDLSDSLGLWKGRATAMLTGVMRALIYMREQNALNLNVSTVRDYMSIKRIIDLADVDKNPDLPVNIRKLLNSYLTSLPGFSVEKGHRQSQTTLDQHGYLEMQFTKILGTLTDVYGHIFTSPSVDIDMSDVVRKRRILVVMLPALEKSTDEIFNLAKIVIGTLRGAIGDEPVSYDQQRRFDEKQPPFFVFLEDVAMFAPDTVRSITAPGYGLSIIASAQRSNDLEEISNTLGKPQTLIHFESSDAVFRLIRPNASPPMLKVINSVFPSTPRSSKILVNRFTCLREGSRGSATEAEV